MRQSPSLTNIDLNLLVALRELVRELSVTHAAQRLGVTQPAASAALSRLRRHFSDELLTRSQGEYVLTPLGTQLAEQIEPVCASVENLFAANTQFDPTTTQRQFTLLMADYTVAAIGRQLSTLMDEHAPHARLNVAMVKESLAVGTLGTARVIDGIVAPQVDYLQTSGMRWMELFRDRWVCVVSRTNRLLGTGTPSREVLARLPWVVPYQREPDTPSAAPIPLQLYTLGIRPHVAVRVESYQAVPYFVTGTDRVALMQERLATAVADRLGLRVLECFGALDPIVETLWWHETHDDDQAHAWFRRLVAHAAHQI